MVPKKSKDIIKPTAKQLELDDQLVKCVTDFYWGEVRSSLGELENCNVTVAGFGIFRASAKRLALMKEKYKNYLAKLDLMTFDKFKVKVEVEHKLTRIEVLFSQMRENMEKKKTIKAQRNGLKEDLE